MQPLQVPDVATHAFLFNLIQSGAVAQFTLFTVVATLLIV
jgi:hypothetical protein